MIRACLLLLLLAGCARGASVKHAAAEHALQGETLYQQGVQLAQQGDVTRAEQYLAAALRAGHQPRQTLEALLGTCVNAGRLRSALSYATPYLAEHPQERGLRLFVATIHFALREPEQAETQLRTLLEQQEAQPEAHYLLGLLLLEEGRERQQMRAHFQRYLQLSPEGRHAAEARAALNAHDARPTPIRRARS